MLKKITLIAIVSLLIGLSLSSNIKASVSVIESSKYSRECSQLHDGIYSYNPTLDKHMCTRSTGTTIQIN